MKHDYFPLLLTVSLPKHIFLRKPENRERGKEENKKKEERKKAIGNKET